jgi:hypothetical protein
MAPYVACVISHPENGSVHIKALLLRSCLVEFSAPQLQALLDQIPTSDSSLPQHLRLPLPRKWDSSANSHAIS